MRKSIFVPEWLRPRAPVLPAEETSSTSGSNARPLASVTGLRVTATRSMSLTLSAIRLADPAIVTSVPGPPISLRPSASASPELERLGQQHARHALRVRALGEALRRDLGPQLLKRRDRPRFGERQDLLLKRGSDPRQVGRPPFARQRRHR